MQIFPPSTRFFICQQLLLRIIPIFFCQYNEIYQIRVSFFRCYSFWLNFRITKTLLFLNRLKIQINEMRIQLIQFVNCIWHKQRKFHFFFAKKLHRVSVKYIWWLSFYRFWWIHNNSRYYRIFLNKKNVKRDICGTTQTKTNALLHLKKNYCFLLRFWNIHNISIS